MALKLSNLLEYENIVIQCHDNPDADALASGFSLQWYLRNKGKNPRFIYGGKYPVSKSNLVLMQDELGIEAEFVTELEKPELLVTVDCQYGESNVTKFDAENVAVIDHHQVSGKLPEMSEVRSSYGACATVMYELLKDEGIDVNSDENISTAMYYGLLTDTNSFAEIFHPSDKDLRDFANFNNSDITHFRNSNLSRDELRIAGDALKNAIYNDKYLYSIVEAEPCDPNILGIISDMLLEVDSVETCLVYSILPFGVKISVRSCIKEVKASELAAFVAQGLGGGGGHLVKAGGFLQKDLIEAEGYSFTPKEIEKLMSLRMEEYYKNSEVIYAGTYEEDISKLKKYMKKSVEVGFVDASKLAPIGTTITIRTLEGDVDVKVEDDLYIIIGVAGEVYPCRKAKFEKAYKVVEGEYVFPGEYPPTVVNAMTGDRIALLPYAAKCIATGGSGIYARVLDKRVKVFTAWDRDKYYLGVEGDYLAVSVDDLSDVYVIAKDIFAKTYEEA